MIFSQLNIILLEQYNGHYKQAQQKMQQAAEAEQLVNSAKTLSEAKTEDKSLLTDVAGQFTQL